MKCRINYFIQLYALDCSLLLLLHSSFHGGSTAVFWEMNCVCDCFPFSCHSGSHILFERVDCSSLSEQCQGYRGWGVFRCAQMLMPDTACRSCVNTVSESALKVESERKISCPTWKLNLHLLQARPNAQPAELHHCLYTVVNHLFISVRRNQPY